LYLHPSTSDKWDPPLGGFIKIHFDGASKGNPGPMGLGGAFINDKGIFYGSMWREWESTPTMLWSYYLLRKAFTLPLEKDFISLLLRGILMFS
jgi:hypothetical protein